MSEPPPRKRKRRPAARAERRAELASHRARRAARTEARNQAVRESLEPLAEGQRPPVVTVGAVVAALLALSAPVAYLAGAEVDGERPEIASVIAPVVVMGAIAWGLWRARYWAAIAFQGLLAIVMVVGTLGLVLAPGIAVALANVLAVAIAGTLFWLMVKAMARIQMAEQDEREEQAEGAPPEPDSHSQRGTSAG